MREIRFRAWYPDENKMVKLKGVQLEPEGPFVPIQGVVLMQFTGLYDKLGNEIWEGDVVRREFGEVGFRAEVFWDPDYADFATDHPRGGINWSLGMSSPMEVIGNVHENPELLK